jgi:YgiT-type zinc finger domain-containing protein
MKCTIQGCPGEYEPRLIIHTVQSKKIVTIIENVPADVCSICGDVLLTPETVLHIEQLLNHQPHPKRTAPVFEYA